VGCCCFSRAAKEVTRIAYASPWRIPGGLGGDKLAAVASLLATIARVVDPSIMFFLEREASVANMLSVAGMVQRREL